MNNSDRKFLEDVSFTLGVVRIVVSVINILYAINALKNDLPLGHLGAAYLITTTVIAYAANDIQHLIKGKLKSE